MNNKRELKIIKSVGVVSSFFGALLVATAIDGLFEAVITGIGIGVLYLGTQAFKKPEEVYEMLNEI